MAFKSTTERTVKTKFDGDASDGIRAARAMERELKRLQRESEKSQAAFVAQTTRGADKVVSGLSAMTKGILAIGSATSSAQGLAGATAAVASLSGVLLAAPGVLAGAAAAGGVFALAMSGIGDAIAAKDLEEFNEATKNMAPNAVDLAKAVRDQNTRFTDLKKTVQGNFFAGFGDDTRALADKYFPILNKQSGAIAGEWNKMGREAAKALLDPRAVSNVNSVLGDTSAGLKELRPSLGNVLTGFLDLSAVGSKRLPALGRAVNGLTEDFEKWVAAGVESGRINKLIDEGIDTAKQFGVVFSNVGSSVGAIWRGLNAGGGDFLDNMVESTQALEDFLKSAEGQRVIKTLGEALNTTADVAREVFSTAMRELGPVVTEIGPAFQEVARAVGDFLVDALEIAGPLLQNTAKFLSENKETLGDLVPLLLGAAVAYKGLSVAKDATTWIGGLSAAFDTSTKKAKDLDGAVGKGGKSGGTGLIGSLAGIAAVVGAGVVIDIVNDSEIAKANDFKISLDGILGVIGKIGESGALGLITKYNDAVIGGVGKAISGAQQGSIVLTISSDTSQAQRNLEDLKDQVRRSEEFITINGNRVPADQALATVVRAIDNGEGTVDINGASIDANRALDDIVGLINRSSGTVMVDGNPVPAGQVLFGLLRTVTGSRAAIGVDANAQAAEDAINYAARNRTATIYVNGVGSVNGQTVFHDRAVGGPVVGPGTGTSDTAGIFRLSNGEHILTAAEVDALGGHGAVFRLRALARQGQLRGFSDGGTPAYMTTSIPAPNRAPSVSVAPPNTSVVVMIDGQKFRGMITTEIENDKRETKRVERSGPGGAW